MTALRLLFLGGTGTLTYQRLAGDEVLPAASKKPESSAPRKELRSRAPADNAAKEIVTFRGRVLDPDGNSVEAVYRGAVASSAAQHTEAA